MDVKCPKFRTFRKFPLGVMWGIWYRNELFSPFVVFVGYTYAAKVLGSARLYAHSAT